jgi:hypothetical protein
MSRIPVFSAPGNSNVSPPRRSRKLTRQPDPLAALARHTALATAFHPPLSAAPVLCSCVPCRARVRRLEELNGQLARRVDELERELSERGVAA